MSTEWSVVALNDGGSEQPWQITVRGSVGEVTARFAEVLWPIFMGRDGREIAVNPANVMTVVPAGEAPDPPV